jgi:cytochrome c peroxidase
MMKFVYIGTLVILLSACSKEPVEPTLVERPFRLKVPEGFAEMPVPEDNQLTVARVELGKKLFFDKMLSRDFSVSCASCHHPNLGFAETNPISLGVNNAIGMRNAPTLANVGYLTALFAEGGVPSLELQAIAPIIEQHEMNLDFATLIERLENNSQYTELFQLAYNANINAQTIVKALASFERTLISGNSKYDQYFYQGKTGVMNESELRGMELFFSDALACSNCHSGFLFTNESMQNIGLYVDYEDEGLARLTAESMDIGKFKVPTLRNIEVTGPYMHNGSISTLEEVIEHFNAGGEGHENQSEWIKPLNLTEQNKADLVNFLKSLTDEEFLNNPLFNE